MRNSRVIALGIVGSIVFGHRLDSQAGRPSLVPQPIEFAGAFPFPGAKDSAAMDLVIPAGVKRVQAIVVFIERDLLRYVFESQDWRTMCRNAGCALLHLGFNTNDAAPPDSQRIRNAKLGGDSALFRALHLAAIGTGHPEIEKAGVVIFGFSASGNFGPTFAATHPGRTIGYIRYHSHLRGMHVDTAALARVPSLNISGALEPTESIDDTRLLWAEMRSRGGAAAFAVHAGQPHKSLDGFLEAGPAMRQWTEALIRRRVAGSGTLVPLSFADGWLVAGSAGNTAPVAEFRDSLKSASWLPDERTAFAFRQLSGMCMPLGQGIAAALLGAGTKIDAEDTEVCHFALGQPRRDLWLSVYTTASDSAAVAWLRNARQAVPLEGIGNFANFSIQPRQQCSTVAGARSVVAFFVSACGDGFGVASDSGRLVPLLRRLMGLN